MTRWSSYAVVRSPQPPSDPDNAAIFWVTRRRLGLIDAESEASFRRWLADSRNSLAYETADLSVEAIGDLAAVRDIAAMREAALAMTSGSRAAPWKIAAICAFLVSVALGAYILWPFQSAAQRRDQFLAKALRLAPTVYSTRKGEQRTVSLDDGSVITLDTATTVQLAFSTRHRDATMLQGQAYFRVAADKHRPFTLIAGDRRITAAAGRFDVRLDPDQIRISQLEGRSVVDPLRPTGLPWLIPSLATQVIDAGQQFASSASSGVLSLATADIERASQWWQHKVIFREDTLESVVIEMNRYSAMPILVDDRSISGLRISGVYQPDRQEDFLATLTAYYPIAVESIRSGTTILLRRRTHD